MSATLSPKMIVCLDLVGDEWDYLSRDEMPVRTALALEKRGLIESRPLDRNFARDDYEYRLTDKGRECREMLSGMAAAFARPAQDEAEAKLREGLSEVTDSYGMGFQDAPWWPEAVVLARAMGVGVGALR